MHEKQPLLITDNHEAISKDEVLKPEEFKKLIESYGLKGDNPKERLDSLKNLSKEALAYLLTEINNRFLDADESMVSSTTMKIGENSVVPVEHRYDLFNHLMEQIHKTSTSINPERVGDALSLGIVLLHPFKDGNGRTARAMGMIFHSEYDSSDYDEDFRTLTESRDIARERGGMIMLGYMPRTSEIGDQSDPDAVKDYFNRVLTEEYDGENYLYTGPFEYPQLYKGVN